MPIRVGAWLGLGLPILVAVLGFGCSSSDDEGGCSSDTDCKGDRICSEGACVAPDGGGAGGTGNGNGGTKAGGAGTGGGPAGGSGGSATSGACTLMSEDCDADCQEACGSPECVELCCQTIMSPGVLCGGRCQPEATRECDGVCVDTSKDANNCGECGTVCARPMFVGCSESECQKPDL